MKFHINDIVRIKDTTSVFDDYTAVITGDCLDVYKYQVVVIDIDDYNSIDVSRRNNMNIGVRLDRYYRDTFMELEYDPIRLAIAYLII